MTDRITSFRLHWYNCGCCCVDDILHEEISLYRNQRSLIFRQYDGQNCLISCDCISLDEKDIENFFIFLQETVGKWETDYRIEVCDGSEWEILMWHSSHKVTKVCGTVEYPPEGKKIEQYIHSFIEHGNTFIAPRMFGCGG